ncbi:MAG: hypothetical protein JO241_05065 [Candidatus Eremiobacteraeota bacterium]|nr:hypothetical protein [Candidatus Eremiobacteraeota bacterium]
MLNKANLIVVTATSVEAKAARRELRGVPVIEAGVALCRLRESGAVELRDSATVSCGLAGGLHHHHPTGTVVIPSEVLRPDGTTLECDAVLTQALREAARRLGIEAVTDAIVTTATLITGSERNAWSQRGYAGVDMETGLLTAPRVAAVRVLLDTPLRELSQEWLHPARALLDPRLWPEAVWLARHAPRCARLAAAIVAGARFT